MAWTRSLRVRRLASKMALKGWEIPILSPSIGRCAQGAGLRVCQATHLIARRPKRIPSSGPRLMVVRARRLAGAWQVRALMRRSLPFPALAVYTAACSTKLMLRHRPRNVTCVNGAWWAHAMSGCVTRVLQATEHQKSS